MGLFGINDVTKPSIGNQWLGNAVDTLGGLLGVKETGWSERIAGGPTVNSSHPLYTYANDGSAQVQDNSVPIYNWEPEPTGGTPTGGTPTGGSPTGGSPSPASGLSGFDMKYYPGWDPTAAQQDWIATGGSKANSGGGGGGVDLNAQMRGQIEGGYNDYFGQLDSMLGGLDTQATNNLGIAQNSYNQSISDLQANKASSLGDLGLTEQKLNANQVKSLRDIASNIQNQYMAGNVMLGARGAGDSSAANQYSYALNRVGSKARGDVMNQTAQSQQEIANQKAKLNNIVTQETSRLDTELGNAKLSISNWLAEQQNAIKGMMAEGRLNKGKDLASLTQNLLTQALTAYQTKAQEISNKRSQLETWAMNNSTNINQLKSNMASIGSFAPNMPTAPTINGGLSSDAQGNIKGMFGFNTQENKDQYGNIIS